jgi:AcrR family transcriptional regulator
MPAATIDLRANPRKIPAGTATLMAVPSLVDPGDEPVPRRRGRPPRLSRPAIFGAALRLLDAEGTGALTMRRLGAEMGVEAMSLYRHVSSKDALLDGIAEALMAEHELVTEDQDWAAAAYRFSIQIRRVALAHPAAFELVGLRALNTVEAIRPVEALLAALRSGGFPPDRGVAAFRLLSGYSRGFALSEIAGFTLASGRRDTEIDRLTGDRLSAEDFPAIHALAGDLARNPTDDDFDAGIETILIGLRRELAGLRRRRRGPQSGELADDAAV